MIQFVDFTQICWVVADLDEAIRRWHRTTGIGPFYCIRSPEIGNYHYRGVPAMLDMDVALAQAGNIQIELIQPKSDTPSAYRDSCPAGTEAMHHLGKVTADFDRDYAHYRDLGFAEAQSGFAGTARFAYFDTRESLGYMIELIERDDALNGMFQMVADAAVNWDGSDPWREISLVQDALTD
ncbi:MAG: VOC family protein [Sphingomonadaceae bacterium]